MLAGGERLEGRLHKLDSLGIDVNSADLFAAHRLADVEIADPRRAVRTAISELTFQAHLDLPAIRARAVGVDAGQDGVDQQTGVVIRYALKR
ncbi:MAG TPA: hypothetical protein VIC06_03135 [Solirubrobacteraceae bacterium]